MTQTKAELLQTRHQGDIRLGDADSTHYVGFKAPATVGTSLVWTLPAADGTAGYYLKTDGSGNLGWSLDNSGVSLSGSTNNTVATVTGANALQGEAALTFDGNILQISHATPQFKSVDTDGTNDYSTFQNSSGQSVYNAVDNNTHGKHLFQTAGTERMRIDSSGQVLINKTTNRDQYYGGTITGKLQVEGTGNASRLTQFIHNTDAASQHIVVIGKTRGTSVGSYTVVQNSDYLGTLSFQGADGDAMIEGARIDALVSGTPGNQDMPTVLTFGTTADGASSTTERMRIDSSGNVGIGTNAPTSNLEIRTTASNGGVVIKSTGNTSNNLTFDANRSAANNGLYTISGRWNGTTVGTIGCNAGDDTTNKDDGYLWFGTESAASNGNVNATERLRIGPSGQIGIGGATYGSSGQVLTSGGSGAAVSWTTVAGGVSSDAQNNTVAGTNAGNSFSGTSATNNQLFGYYAGNAITTGDNNTMAGFYAGNSTTTGGYNTFYGNNAGVRVSTGSSNTAVGSQALGYTSGACTGENNIAIGTDAAYQITSGDLNTCIGNRAGFNITTGDENVFIGQKAGEDLTTGEDNVGVGKMPCRRITTGSFNIGIGRFPCYNVTTGDGNICIGDNSGFDITTGSHNSLLGYSAQASSATVSNEVTLGSNNVTSLRCNVQSISSLSDGRDKTDINTLDLGLDFINSLNPVKFKWNSREGLIKDGTYEAGFIAQDLQQVQKDNNADYLGLVLDNNPDRLEASYGNLIPMLVQAVKELSTEVTTLKNKVAALEG